MAGAGRRLHLLGEEKVVAVLRRRDTAAGEGFFPGVGRMTVPVVVVAAAAAAVAVASVHTTEVLQLVLGYGHHGCGHVT